MNENALVKSLDSSETMLNEYYIPIRHGISKAVVWTDVVQDAVMLFSILLAVLIGVRDTLIWPAIMPWRVDVVLYRSKGIIYNNDLKAKKKGKHLRNRFTKFP